MNPGTVVVVEDNDLNMRLMRDLLTAVGFNMVGLPDGEGLCDVVAKEAPLVVLMDIQLPKWSGVELRGFLANDPRTADVPVYAVTANCDAASVEAYAKADFAGVFKKPVKVKELVATLLQLRKVSEAS